MNLFDWNVTLSHISDLSDWLPFIVWIFLPETKRNQYKLLGAYFFVLGFFKTTTLLLLLVKGQYNTMPFYHAMAIGEVSLLYLFLTKGIFKSSKVQYLILASICSFNLINAIYFQNYDEFNSNAWALNTILLIGFGLYTLILLFNKFESIELEKSDEFIVIAGLLLYFSGSLFLYIVSSEVLSKEANGLFHNAWIIRSAADIIKSIILTYGLWLACSNKTN